VSRAACDVCGRRGEFVSAPVRRTEDAPAGAVGRCRRCQQYLCLEHAERLEDGYLGCPFDPGVRLGTPERAEERP
jgi:hypothetical protein